MPTSITRLDIQGAPLTVYRQMSAEQVDQVREKGCQIIHIIRDINPKHCPFCFEPPEKPLFTTPPPFGKVICSPTKIHTFNGREGKKSCTLGGYHWHFNCNHCGTLWIAPIQAPHEPVGYI